jgi:hypothetical protein
VSDAIAADCTPLHACIRACFCLLPHTAGGARRRVRRGGVSGKGAGQSAGEAGVCGLGQGVACKRVLQEPFPCYECTFGTCIGAAWYVFASLTAPFFESGLVLMPVSYGGGSAWACTHPMPPVCHGMGRPQVVPPAGLLAAPSPHAYCAYEQTRRRSAFAIGAAPDVQGHRARRAVWRRGGRCIGLSRHVVHTTWQMRV